MRRLKMNSSEASVLREVAAEERGRSPKRRDSTPNSSKRSTQLLVIKEGQNSAFWSVGLLVLKESGMADRQVVHRDGTILHTFVEHLLGRAESGQAGVGREGVGRAEPRQAPTIVEPSFL
ncbi:hypothetical protein Dimus_030125 [Dionaea muscipula]